MIRRSVHEWGYVPVRGDLTGDGISRAMADDLIVSAQASHVGGPDGEGILVNGHNRLRAQQVVGILASPSVTLEILPKIDGLDDGATRYQLVRMLARVYDLQIADGPITNLGWQNQDLLEIIIKLFCDQLFRAVHRGLPRRYIEHEDDLPSLRGGMNIVRQFSILAAAPQKLACRYDELTPDISLNRIMKAAVTRLRGISRALENQRRLRELSYAFADVTTVPVSSLPWDTVVLDRTNSAWGRLVAFAKLLLGDRFQTTSVGEARGFSLLFEMNTLFEEYIGRSLRRALAHHPFEIMLQGPRSHILVAENNNRRFATKPDITISQAGQPQIIIDTKWKRLTGKSVDQKWGVSQADIYQMVAYAQVYGCERLLLLYPHHEQLGSPEGVLESFKIAGREEVRLMVASVSLFTLLNIEQRLERLVGSCLNPATTSLASAA